jgi:hypothetical protein
MNLLQNATQMLIKAAVWQGGTGNPNLTISYRPSTGFTLNNATDTTAQKSKRAVGLVLSRGFTDGLPKVS